MCGSSNFYYHLFPKKQKTETQNKYYWRRRLFDCNGYGLRLCCPTSVTIIFSLAPKIIIGPNHSTHIVYCPSSYHYLTLRLSISTHTWSLISAKPSQALPFPSHPFPSFPSRNKRSQLYLKPSLHYSMVSSQIKRIEMN